MALHCRPTTGSNGFEPPDTSRGLQSSTQRRLSSRSTAFRSNAVRADRASINWALRSPPKSPRFVFHDASIATRALTGSSGSVSVFVLMCVSVVVHSSDLTRPDTVRFGTASSSHSSRRADDLSLCQVMPLMSGDEEAKSATLTSQDTFKQASTSPSVPSPYREYILPEHNVALPLCE